MSDTCRLFPLAWLATFLVEARERHARTVFVAIGMALVLDASACKPKAGEHCSAGSAVCTAPNAALFCQDDAYVAVACDGATGCAQAGAVARCDLGGDSPGSTCVDWQDGRATRPSASRASPAPRPAGATRPGSPSSHAPLRRRRTRVQHGRARHPRVQGRQAHPRPGLSRRTLCATKGKIPACGK